MIRFSNGASSLRLQLAIFSGLIAGFVLVSSVSALDLDFNVASGNYNVASNWIDVTNPIPVAAAATPSNTAVSTTNGSIVVGDGAYIRNGGTVSINSNVEAGRLWIGRTRNITNPDYNGSTVVDAGDYVLWRTGEILPTATELVTLGTTTSEDYDVWRLRYGGTPVSENIGQGGTLLWTDGEITGPVSSGPNLGGVDIRVGRHEVINSVITEIPGTVVQNGINTKVLMPYGDSSGSLTNGHGSGITIGDAGTGAFSHNPISSYTLIEGEIGTGVSGGTGSSGTNGNNGIYVRNGTFNMQGGKITDVTQAAFAAVPTAQRFLTVAGQAGGGVGNEAIATANLSGGTVNSLGGIRVGTANHSKGIVNISGSINIVTGGDTEIGYQPNTGGINGTGELNMSGGYFQVGRTDPNPNNGNAPYNLAGRLIVGARGKGVLNMTGGTINATRNVVVGNEAAMQEGSPTNPKTLGSAIYMTGGSITTGGLELRRSAAPPGTPDPQLPTGEYSASVILDGPTASFVTTGLGSSPVTTIGGFGKGLFEVRQGTAVLGGNNVSMNLVNSVYSEAVINVKNTGKLTLASSVTRTVLNPATDAEPLGAEPVFGLTGGTLVFDNSPTATAQGFLANLKNEGSTLDIKPSVMAQVTIGRRTSISPALDPVSNNFEMTSGSWNIDLASNLATGLNADWFNASNGTAKLTGGTLNLNYLSGFTPVAGTKYRILRGGLGTTLGSVTINAPGGSWSIEEAPITTDVVNWPLDEEIRLVYNGPGSGTGGGLGGSAVPEPTSAVLLVFAAAGLLTARRSRPRS